MVGREVRAGEGIADFIVVSPDGKTSVIFELKQANKDYKGDDDLCRAVDKQCHAALKQIAKRDYSNMAFATNVERCIHVAICFYAKVPFVKCKESRRSRTGDGWSAWEVVPGFDETDDELVIPHDFRLD